MRKAFETTVFERLTAFILALSHAGLGLYFAGPWYILTNDKTFNGQSPNMILLPNELSIHIYGVVLLVSSIVLAYAAARGPDTTFLARALLVNLLLRLYHVFGTMLVLESWLPPAWTSRVSTVAIMAVLWLWWKYNERTAR